MAGKKAADDRRLTFTKAKLDALAPCSKPGQTDNYYDERQAGLALRVTATGRKSFYYIGRANGAVIFHRVGTYPLMTIDQARNSVAKLLGNLATGLDVQQARRALKAELTVDELFAIYEEKHARQKKSSKDDEQRYRIHVQPFIGKKKLSTVTSQDIGRIAEKMESSARAPATINRVRSLIGIMFNKAVEWNYTSQPNPVKAMKAQKEKSRTRFLNADELPRFFSALEQELPEWKDFFTLLLLLGQRRENTLSMRWKDIVFAECAWHIPMTKNGEAHTVPITEDALAILKSRYEAREEHAEFVFPGRGKSGHLAEPKTAWARIVKNADIEGVRIHDLRRTLGSWLAMNGVNLPTIAKTMGHKDLKTTAVYARLDIGAVRDAMQTANNKMLSSQSVKPSK